MNYRKVTLYFSFLLGLIFFSACESTSSNKVSDAIDETINVPTKKTIILTIDGGGIKGVIPAYFLKHIEETGYFMPSFQLFDVIGGTSTGGIISVGLTAQKGTTDSPFKASDILDMYLNDCTKMLVKNHQPTGPDYYAARHHRDGKTEGIESFLRELVTPTRTLKEAHDFLAPKGRVQQVFTTTYVLNSTGGDQTSVTNGKDYGPFLFNWKDALKNDSNNYYLWEAARGTSAAPGYFPIAHVGGGNQSDLYRSEAAEKWVMDGGTMSNNPTVWGVTEALRTGLAESLDDIIVISLGCGIDPFDAGIGVTNEGRGAHLHGQKHGFWNSTYWLDDLYNLTGLKKQELAFGAIVNLLLDANQLATNNQIAAMQSAGLTYFRLQPQLPKDLTPMADCSHIDALHDVAIKYIGPNGKGQGTMDQILAILKTAQNN